MNYRKLQSEIVTDVLGLYSGLNNQEIADKINNSSRGVNVDSTSNGDILSAIEPTEFSALNASNRESLLILLTPQSLNLNDSNIIADITTVFSNGSASNIAIFSLATAIETRSEELGLGYISAQMVETALAGRG